MLQKPWFRLSHTQTSPGAREGDLSASYAEQDRNPILQCVIQAVSVEIKHMQRERVSNSSHKTEWPMADIM